MRTPARLSVFALCAATLWGCSCGDRSNKTAPRLEVPSGDGMTETLSLDFGSVQLGAKTVRTVQLDNAGNAGLNIQSFTVAEPFGTDTAAPLEVGIGQQAALAITFTPTQADQLISGTLTINSDDPNRPALAIALKGKGINGLARVSPAALAFGDVYLKETKSLTLTVTNAGSNALEIKAARLTGVPASVGGALEALQTTLMANASASATLTFAPLTAGAISGALELELSAEQGGVLSTPITGRGTEAVPRLCLKFDDTALESCTDAVATSLQVPFGTFCDARVFPPDAGPNPCVADGGTYGRGAKLYFRNEGNVPVAYSVQYNLLPGAAVRCDGGARTSDFDVSAVARFPDGGFINPTPVPTTQLPGQVTDPRPWESPSVDVRYTARSNCPAEASDQMFVIWTRQSEPPGTTRTPSTLFATFQGGSKLPSAVASGWSCGTAGAPATVPCEVDFFGVNNAGTAPLSVLGVELFVEIPDPFTDGGVQRVSCNQPSPDPDCQRFKWQVDPNTAAPHVLPATTVAGMATQLAIGKLVFGPQGSGTCTDGGFGAVVNKQYRLIAQVRTDDPYRPLVNAVVLGVAGPPPNRPCEP